MLFVLFWQNICVCKQVSGYGQFYCQGNSRAYSSTVTHFKVRPSFSSQHQSLQLLIPRLFPWQQFNCRLWISFLTTMLLKVKQGILFGVSHILVVTRSGALQRRGLLADLDYARPTYPRTRISIFITRPENSLLIYVFA